MYKYYRLSERVIMLFPGYLPTFTALISEPLLNMNTASYMSVILAIHEINALRERSLIMAWGGSAI